MMIKRRVFISVPLDDHISPQQVELKNGIISKIENSGYEPQIFFLSGLAGALSWNFDTVNEVMNRCVGAVIIGFTRWQFSRNNEEFRFPSEYNHYEGALVNSLNIPLLTLTEKGTVDRGIHWTGGGNPLLYFPANASVDWLDSDIFKTRFNIWLDALEERKDIFLGYCSNAKATAQAVHLFLEIKLGVTVLDWAMDFTGGGTILDEIGRASRLCTCGIFLFTRDDPLEGDSDKAAPRDNVVFEAGYFINSKGKERVLVIREKGAKMPADLGGNIYAHLENVDDISPIESTLRDFAENRL